MKSLETALRALRDSGQTALVPYFMAGLTDDWTTTIDALVDGGADAIEIGLPFSDPLMDGVVIQQAGTRALERGANLDSILEELGQRSFGVPLIVMTYYNVLLHEGLESAAAKLHKAGVSGAIIPDLTLEESAGWRAACDANDIATILMVAPSTNDARATTLVAATEGFAYASARMAVTGAASDEGSGGEVVSMIRKHSDVPAYIGIGITTPAQAAQAGQVADGVIVGSALVKLIMNGASRADVTAFVASLRAAL
jgi:tryptophan synthase alpha chain